MAKGWAERVREGRSARSGRGKAAPGANVGFQIRTHPDKGHVGWRMMYRAFVLCSEGCGDQLQWVCGEVSGLPRQD